MKTETFTIRENEIESFKDACLEVSGVNFLYYEDTRVIIEFKYEHSLFYLGRMFELKKQLCTK